MSDLAKKCADRMRKQAVVSAAFDRPAGEAAEREHNALAAFIEAAQALRSCNKYVSSERWSSVRTAYDAALRDLAQSMEVE